jgi:hypothetical protein
MARKPRAPVFLSMASWAMPLRASGAKVKSTFYQTEKVNVNILILEFLLPCPWQKAFGIGAPLRFWVQ